MEPLEGPVYVVRIGNAGYYSVSHPREPVPLEKATHLTHEEAEWIHVHLLKDGYSWAVIGVRGEKRNVI